MLAASPTTVVPSKNLLSLRDVRAAPLRLKWIPHLGTKPVARVQMLEATDVSQTRKIPGVSRKLS